MPSVTERWSSDGMLGADGVLAADVGQAAAAKSFKVFFLFSFKKKKKKINFTFFMHVFFDSTIFQVQYDRPSMKSSQSVT